MKLICLRCGFPWFLEDVLLGDQDDFLREGCMITRCVCCSHIEDVQFSPKKQEYLDALHAAAKMFGHDYEGFATLLAEVHFC